MSCELEPDQISIEASGRIPAMFLATEPGEKVVFTTRSAEEMLVCSERIIYRFLVGKFVYVSLTSPLYI